MFRSPGVRLNHAVLGQVPVTVLVVGGLAALLHLLVCSGYLFLNESAPVYQHKSLLSPM